MRILATASPGEVRVAAAEGDTLVDYTIWRPGAPDGVGDLHLGRVSAMAPAMAGAFVALDGADGFLPDSEGAGHAHEGLMLGVRVTRAAQGGKGPRLTARLAAAEQAAIPAAGPPRLLRRGPGGLERLAGLHPQAPVLVDDAALLAALRPLLRERVSLGRALWGDVLAASIDALAAPSVALPGGGAMHVHPTPALVAIDFDIGAATGARQAKAAAQLAANRAALPELARQIRLRNLSGAILVDLAGLSLKQRGALGPELAAALQGDPLQPRFLGFSALGLAEILRPRVHPPLHDCLAGPHAAGLAGLRTLAADIVANPGRAPVLRAAPGVTAALQADPIAREDVARRAGQPLVLLTDPTLPPGGWLPP